VLKKPNSENTIYSSGIDYRYLSKAEIDLEYVWLTIGIDPVIVKVKLKASELACLDTNPSRALAIYEERFKAQYEPLEEACKQIQAYATWVDFYKFTDIPHVLFFNDPGTKFVLRKEIENKKIEEIRELKNLFIEKLEKFSNYRLENKFAFLRKEELVKKLKVQLKALGRKRIPMALLFELHKGEKGGFPFNRYEGSRCGYSLYSDIEHRVGWSESAIERLLTIVRSLNEIDKYTDEG